MAGLHCGRLLVAVGLPTGVTNAGFLRRLHQQSPFFLCKTLYQLPSLRGCVRFGPRSDEAVVKPCNAVYQSTQGSVGPGRVLGSLGALGCFCALRQAAGGMPNWVMNQRVKELAME